MDWQLKAFAELSNLELFEIYKHRVDVFVVEQGCAYPEIDEADLAARHLFARQNGKITAYCRILPSPQSIKIGRVLVVRNARGAGLARRLMRRALAYIAGEFYGLPVRVQAQAYLLGFYGSLGFEAVSEEYLEDGIPHLDMVLTQAGFSDGLLHRCRPSENNRA